MSGYWISEMISYRRVTIFNTVEMIVEGSSSISFTFIDNFTVGFSGDVTFEFLIELQLCLLTVST